MLVGALLVLFPAVALASQRYLTRVPLLSPIVLCCLAGLVVAHVPGVDVRSVSSPVAEGAVLASLPLLLFSSDLSGAVRSARRALLSFLLAALSVVVSACLAAWLLPDVHPRAGALAGMVVGVYTGGTPNLTAVGLALGVDEATFVLMNAADLVLCSAYLLVLLSVARPLLSRVLPSHATAGGAGAPHDDVRVPSPFERLLQRDAALALVLALVVSGGSVGVVWLFFGALDIAAIVLLLTSTGIALSFVPRVRALRGSYETGEYLLLVFALAVCSLTSLPDLLASLTGIFSFVAFALVVAIALHFSLCAVFRIDVDTALVTSAAAVFGPAFVGPVATALRNRTVILPGIATGVLGYAVGTYAGLAVAWALSP